MAVVNHPNPPHDWRDGDGNVDWDAYADQAREAAEASWTMEALGNGRSISRGFGGCATCDGAGCGDCIDR